MKGNNQALMLWLCLLCSLILLPSEAYGQEKGDSISGKVHQIENVTVTAERTKQQVKSISPFQQLNQKQLQQQGITDIADALRRFSGVNIKDYGGAGGMKTISVRSLGAKHTAVVYDGVTLSDCQSGQIDLSRFSIDNIQQISLTIGDNEDIFVPARTVASAASLKLQSVTPDFSSRDNHFKGQIKTGSFGMISPYVHYSHKISEKIAASATGEFMRADNLYPFTLVNGDYVTKEKRYNNSIQTYRGEVNLYVRPNDRSTLNGKIYYYDVNQQLPGAVILYNAENREKLQERNFFSQIHYRTYWENNLSLQLNGKFNWSQSHYHDEGGKYPGGELNDRYFQREYYASGALLYVPSKHWSMVYAADYMFNNLNANTPNNKNPYRHSILQTATLRYQTTHVTAVAMLLGSIYINGAKEGKGADNRRKLSPSLSLSWKPLAGEHLYLRASYKDIFRVATFSENYFDRMGSRDLRPEKAQQFNAGVTYQNNFAGWLPTFSVTIDGYYNKVKDKIVAMPYNMFTWNMVNLGKVDIWGIDANINTTFRIEKDYSFIFAGNYTYQYAVDKTDPEVVYYKHQIAYTPRHSAGASLAFENPFVNFSFHATGVSKRYVASENRPSNEMKGYIEYGLSLYRNFKIKKLTYSLRGDIINLGNKQYDIVKSYPMPGRSYKLTCSINF